MVLYPISHYFRILYVWFSMGDVHGRKVKKVKERLDYCQKMHQNMLALILDPELLQHSMQFYCSLAEWLSLQITAGRGYGGL